MIQEFSITNTFSIKDTQTISFEAVNTGEEDKIHIVEQADKKILKMACIYGANASGKTNMAHAFKFYMGFLLFSFIELKPDEPTRFTPFLFDEESKNKPGRFNLIFYANDFDNENKTIRYEYNLELNEKEVVYESLYYSPKGQKKLIFERTTESIKWGSFVRGTKKVIEDLTRPNSSLIGAGAQVNHPIFSYIYKHFSNRIKSDFQFNGEGLSEDVMQLIVTDKDFKNKVIGLLSAADFGSITDFKVESHFVPDAVIKMLPSSVQDEILKSGKKPVNRVLKVVHHYDKDYELPLVLESAGTTKMLELTMPLVQLADSSVAVIDEIETSLHQVLLETFIQLYLETSTDSQLIFTTHNQDLLDSDLLRDDEVWFCYKTDKGNSIYNSITDFTGIRKETSRKKLYEAGKFGGLPVVDMQKLREIFSL